MNNIRGNYIDRLGFNRDRDLPPEPKSARTTHTNRFSMDTYQQESRLSQRSTVNLTVVRDPQAPKEMQRTELQLNQQNRQEPNSASRLKRQSSSNLQGYFNH